MKIQNVRLSALISPFKQERKAMIPQPLLHGIVFICSILIFLIPDIAEASEPEKYTLKAEECRQGDLLRWNGRDGLPAQLHSRKLLHSEIQRRKTECSHKIPD